MAKKKKSASAGLKADVTLGAIHKFSDDAHGGIKFETTDLPCQICIKDVPVESIEEVYAEFVSRSLEMIKEGKVKYEAFLQELNEEDDEEEDEDEEEDLDIKVKLTKKELAAIMDFLNVIKLAKTSKDLERAGKSIKKAKALKKCNAKQKKYIKIAYEQRADQLDG